MAGTGKKADQRKTQIWKDLQYFGKHGFTSVKKLRLKGDPINLDDLMILADKKFPIKDKGSLENKESKKGIDSKKDNEGRKNIESKKDNESKKNIGGKNDDEGKNNIESRESKDLFEIDLAAEGYRKLLGRGKVTRKLRIKVAQASAQAIEKAKASGCEIVLTNKKSEKNNDKKNVPV